MADIQIDSGMYTAMYRVWSNGALVWTNELTAYMFFLDATPAKLVYRKTTDGGATWGAQVTIGTAVECSAFNIWFDKWSPNDVGDKIHIAYIHCNENKVQYNSLDTSDDSLSGEVTIVTSSGFYVAPYMSLAVVSITKSRAGNLYVGFWGNDNNDVENGFYRSPDGSSWTEKTTMADGVLVDYIIFMPGNEADTDDIWCIYWDRSADEINLKVYDQSANSWSTTKIDDAVDNVYMQMRAVQRHSDNHVLLVFFDSFNNAAANLKFYDIASASSITAKTNVLTNSDDSAVASILLNQNNNDIYVAYINGVYFTSDVDTCYKKSDDGGATWGSQVQFSENADDDQRGIWAGISIGGNGPGGKFQPVWFNDDLNDLYTNTNNAVSVADIPIQRIEAKANIKQYAFPQTVTAKASIYNYLLSTIVQSDVIKTTISDITNATLNVKATVPSGTTITYYVSADNGDNWQEITPDTPTELDNPGKQLKFKATLTSNRLNTAELDTLNFDISFGAEETVQTITAKANIQTTIEYTQTITDKGRIQKSFTQTITAKGRIEKASTQSITSKGSIQKSFIQTITAKGRIQIGSSQTITAKGKIQKSFTQNITALANIKVTTTQSITAKARIQKEFSQSITAKGSIKKESTQSLTAKARIQIGFTQTITSKGRIQLGSTQSITAKGRITTSFTQTITAKGDIKKTTTRNIQAKGRIQIASIQSITAKGKIQKEFSQSIQSKAKITATTTQTIETKGNIKKQLAQSIQAKADIKKSFTQSVTSKGRIQISSEQTLTAKGRIAIGTVKTITAKANIRSIITQTITAKGSIKKSATRSILAKGSIQKQFIQTVNSKGRIQKSSDQTITAKGRIEKGFLQTITAKSAIKRTFTQTLEAKGRIESADIRQTITAKAKIICISKTILVTPEQLSNKTSPLYLVWEIPSCCKERNIHAHVQVDKTDNTFGDLEKDLFSFRDANFEYWDGDSWEPYPTAGVTSVYYGNQARVLVSLTSGTKYWRVKGGVK